MLDIDGNYWLNIKLSKEFVTDIKNYLNPLIQKDFKDEYHLENFLRTSLNSFYQNSKNKKYENLYKYFFVKAIVGFNVNGYRTIVGFDIGRI